MNGVISLITTFAIFFYHLIMWQMVIIYIKNQAIYIKRKNLVM